MSTPPTPDAEEIRHALRQVMDPEVGMNIVDLGLIYRIDCAPGELYIEMTMTTPACPLSDMILDNIDAVLDPLLPPEVNIRVELVEFIRPERKFPGLDALKAQISADCATALKILRQPHYARGRFPSAR